MEGSPHCKVSRDARITSVASLRRSRKSFGRNKALSNEKAGRRNGSVSPLHLLCYILCDIDGLPRETHQF